ncbi:M48 family metallopeptidase [Sphingomonas sp. ZT3P38]|uniref:M48 family metallopeptidase n=1 Tax=Parasphingomonas zepuensis TaxID=3096161 RepID=UPI002FCC40CC
MEKKSNDILAEGRSLRTAITRLLPTSAISAYIRYQLAAQRNKESLFNHVSEEGQNTLRRSTFIGSSRAIFLLAGLICAGFILSAPPAWAADREGLLAMQRLDQRVMTIGYRLVTSAGDLCADQAPTPGFAIHDRSQYRSDEQAVVRETFGFDGEPLVLAIAPDSPAALAGLQVGDALIRIGTDPVAPPQPGATNSYTRVAAVLAQLDSAARTGTIVLELRRKQQLFTATVALRNGCATRFQTKVSDTIDAQADGRYVEVNTGLIAFAGSDDQLAVIMAHELAHNILHHRARLDAAGVARGILGQFGKNARLIRETEAEADRLGVYLMDRAGYAPQAAIAFWTRFGTEHGLGIFTAPTHLNEEKRVQMIKGEIARIEAMRAAHVEPRPAFLSAPYCASLPGPPGSTSNSSPCTSKDGAPVPFRDQ